MAIVNKLNGYEAIRAIAKYKKISVDLGTQILELEVRVPLRLEMDEINRKVAMPSTEATDAQYKLLTKDLDFDDPELAKVIEATGTFKMVDGEVSYDGKSVKLLAWQLASYQTQIEEYFALIKSASGEPITESYAEIAGEFTDEQIRNFVGAIQKAIYPQVDDVKKN